VTNTEDGQKITEYENHYSTILNKCFFLEIVTSIKTKGTEGISTIMTLFNLNEHKEYGTFYMEQDRKLFDEGYGTFVGTVYSAPFPPCKWNVQHKACHSASEWREWLKPLHGRVDGLLGMSHATAGKTTRRRRSYPSGMLKEYVACSALLAIALSHSAIAQSSQHSKPEVNGGEFSANDSRTKPPPPSKLPTGQDIADVIANAIERAGIKLQADHSAAPADNFAWWFNCFFTAFTGVLVAVGAVQTFLIFFTLKATEKAANAAETAANAALLALDRPWIHVEALRNIQDNPSPQIERAIAGFKLTNHGKAPACVLSVKATLFYSPGLYHAKELPKPLPNTMKDFPTAEAVRVFKATHSKAAIDPTIVSGGNANIRPYFVIPTSYTTHEYQFIGANIEIPDRGIPIEFAGNLYLIGDIIYTMPGDATEILSFCYEASWRKEFSLVYGAPYNERKKAEFPLPNAG
jgi:hypothetical protein